MSKPQRTRMKTLSSTRSRPSAFRPFVEDRRNILLIKPAYPLEESAMASLQYALKRGIEAEFQLEESELMVERCPGEMSVTACSSTNPLRVVPVYSLPGYGSRRPSACGPPGAGDHALP